MENASSCEILITWQAVIRTYETLKGQLYAGKSQIRNLETWWWDKGKLYRKMPRKK